MGFLDVIHKYTDIDTFLEKEKDLNDDLLALKIVCKEWNTKKQIHVGESGTIYRFFKFASWKLGLDKEFVLEKTLKGRAICDDSSITDLPLQELLKIDNRTSQWASASILMGNTEHLSLIPYKLQVSYDALEHWNKARNEEGVWKPRYDETILNQANAFVRMCKGEEVRFVPEQAEDYCFARIFGFISKQEGRERWPALQSHETDRIYEMEKTIEQIENDEPIDSKDHRVVQAAAMFQKLNGLPSTVEHPEAVNKSWPQFWKFLGILN